MNDATLALIFVAAAALTGLAAGYATYRFVISGCRCQDCVERYGPR